MPVATAQKVEALSSDFRSQRKLAEALGVSPAQVGRWIRGQGIDPVNAERVDVLELVMASLLRLYAPAAAELWLFGFNPAPRRPAPDRSRAARPRPGAAHRHLGGALRRLRLIYHRVSAVRPASGARRARAVRRWIPRTFQGAGRHDNPELYGAMYVSEESAVTCGGGAGAVPRVERAWPRRCSSETGRPLALGHARGARRSGRWSTSTSPATLAAEGPAARRRWRPAERSRTQQQAAALYATHPDAAGLRWWSTLESLWINVTLVRPRRWSRSWRLRDVRIVLAADRCGWCVEAADAARPLLARRTGAAKKPPPAARSGGTPPPRRTGSAPSPRTPESGSPRPGGRPRSAAPGASLPSDRATTPGCSGCRASRGKIVTPTPAATSAWEAIVSSASKATFRSNPASWHARSVIARQPLVRPLAIHGSSATSARRRRRRSASGWSAASTRSYCVVDQVEGLQRLAQRLAQRREVVDQREVDLAGAQLLLGLGRLGLDHAQLHVGVALVEGRHGARHQRGAGALEAGEAQPAAAQPGQRGQLLLGVLDPAQDRLGVRHQRSARVGEAHAARSALEQGGAGLTFQRRHLL